MQLLRQRLHHKQRWAELKPYWASLPPADALYCKELALPHHAAELQDAVLVCCSHCCFTLTSYVVLRSCMCHAAQVECINLHRRARFLRCPLC